jgi:hypothetical protein
MAIERTLHEWGWWRHLEERGPMLGDFQLWELLDWAETVFGSALGLDHVPGLAGFHRDFTGRDICTALLAEHPCPITARPGEADVIARIRQAVA